MPVDCYCCYAVYIAQLYNRKCNNTTSSLLIAIVMQYLYLSFIHVIGSAITLLLHF